MKFHQFFSSTFHEGLGWGGGFEIYLAFHTSTEPNLSQENAD